MTNYIERYWRDATPADAIKEPPMMARFWDEDAEDWEYDLLVGWDRTDKCRWRSELDAFEQCQVYDAPDPGEGWRLIDVENETKQEGDEYWHHMKKWVIADDGPFCRRDTYRRRIEQPTPEPRYEPFRWEDREQLRGRWIVDRTGEQEYTIDDFLNDDGVLYICGHPAEYFLNWRFLDTGEPVGRRVE